MKKSHFLIALLLSFFVQCAFAVSLFDLRADALMMKLPELKTNLKLNANQLILWQQSESKTNSLLRARELRMIKVEAGVRDMMQQPNVELRDIDARLNEEQRASDQDKQQGREIWLVMFDALDDSQRQLVQNFLYEQLMEVDVPDRGSKDVPAAPPRQGRGMSHNQNSTNTTNSF